MESYYFQFVLTAILLVGYLLTKWSLTKLLRRLGITKKVPEIRVKNITRYFHLVLFLTLIVLMMMVWGIDYKGLLVFASSALAVIGVALVAQWSILSNITAGVIVFFSFPARIGDTIEIVDGATKMKGTITEINLFQVILQDEKGQSVAYPNNLILQRPVVKVSSESRQPNGRSSWQTRVKLHRQD
ncbi:small-conductance mechanosensitive channel [Hydrogenovibrio sp. SC-1]|uniref:mechanosensitive ion channel domain-containing protein n=1 Tax=Hydrogenovibrio sp. SC-1 TaxID=2065820 RepID=UPI000C7CA5BB|nr:mechanosensitive ion channel family protein [Hydrogenovibrio sp. SC-1]PLA75300.1 small-conductance mechanosensitive channel [Hydrogenovibrio sp. SC-1]